MQPTESTPDTTGTSIEAMAARARELLEQHCLTRQLPLPLIDWSRSTTQSEGCKELVYFGVPAEVDSHVSQEDGWPVAYVPETDSLLDPPGSWRHMDLRRLLPLLDGVRIASEFCELLDAGFVVDIDPATGDLSLDGDAGHGIGRVSGPNEVVVELTLSTTIAV